MVMQRPMIPGYGGMPTARPLTQPQPQQQLPVIASPVRLNPDGSAAPTTGLPSTSGALQTPQNPLTGQVAGLGLSGAGAASAIQAPSTLLQTLFQSQHRDPYAGLLDQVSGMLDPDKLDMLMAILGATQGVTPSPGDTANTILGIQQGLMGQNQLPNLSQILGPVFGMANGQRGNPASSPLYGILTGGDPSQQVGMLLNAVTSMAGLSGMNDLQARGLAARLNALSREYLAGQNQVQSGGGTSFLDWLERSAPQLAHTLGG
jgi:hypothetical protein